MLLLPIQPNCIPLQKYQYPLLEIAHSKTNIITDIIWTERGYRNIYSTIVVPVYVNILKLE